MVSWPGNKKPLSSFPAEAESPRGAVLAELCNTKFLSVKDKENFDRKSFLQKSVA
ncbi:MAG: hypothetical protein H6R15_3245 [Proteobacteria bacterium]|nr:hypothetical protein [Pseudomonadota bacterium]